MRLGLEIGSGIVQICGNVHFQAAIREDFADDLLPGMVVFDHEGTQGLSRHAPSTATEGRRNRKVVPWCPSLSTVTEPPRRVISVFTHHKPNPNLPGCAPVREKFSSKIWL